MSLTDEARPKGKKREVVALRNFRSKVIQAQEECTEALKNQEGDENDETILSQTEESEVEMNESEIEESESDSNKKPTGSGQYVKVPRVL